MSEFAIATCWDDAWLTELAALNDHAPRGRFAEVFGAHRTNLIGGGRPAFRLPDVTESRFDAHVARCCELGLRFNYVMNAPDLGGQESDKAWQGEFLRFVDSLVAAGVAKVTLAHPTLIALVRNAMPDLAVVVSLIAEVDTVDEARRYEDMGVAVINLDPFTINRDFETLAAIREAVGCQLELYANIACLDRCPRRRQHYRHSAHASRPGVSLSQDRFLQHCSRAFLDDPTQLLRSPFIRPEDVGTYWDLGIDIIKLADRTEPAEILMRTARAYDTERCDGNLFELIFRRGKKFRAAVAGSCPSASTMAVPIVIDSGELDRLDFLRQVSSLAGADADTFYRHATDRAVRFTDPALIDTWRKLLCQAGPA